MVESASGEPRLASNETAFPRGGGSVLTPLEMKKISNKAAEDVLFELGKPAEKRSVEDGKTSSKRRKKSRDKKSDTKKTGDTTEETEIHIPTLSFKNIHPGTSVLGQVVLIDTMSITLALGANLFGQVPITHMSAEISEAVEKYEKFVDDSSEDEDEEESTEGTSTGVKLAPALPKLKKLFSIGQWLSAVVVPHNDTDKKIQLTIEPEAVNVAMEEEDLTPGNVVQGSVKSLEDHGVVFSVGLDGLSGFMPKKELKKADIKVSDMHVGQVVLSSIASKTSRAITLRPAFNENVSKTTTVNSTSSIDAVHPGAVVAAVITEYCEKGVVARVFGLANGYISLPHAQEYSLDKLKNHFAIGARVRARVLATVIEENEKKFLLSRADRVLALQNKLNSEPLEAFPIGFVFEDPVEVVGVDDSYLYVSMGAAAFKGQVHKSNIDTDAGLKFYQPGSKHRARVLGFNEIDNLLVLTMKTKAIESQFVSQDDIPVGEFVAAAEVTRIMTDGSGLMLKIFGDFDAIVPANHLLDVKLVYPERKFRVGGKVKARVLYKHGRKIFATVRKSLVNMDEHSIVTSFDNLAVGFRTSGIVDKFVGSGVLVSFFGYVRAYLPKAEISESFVEDARDFLKEGQAVSVRILSVDPVEKRATVSLRQSTELSDAQVRHLEEIDVGRSIVDASVVEKTKEAVLVELAGSNLRGVLSTGHLSDGNYEACRTVYKRLKVGETLPVLVLEKDMRARAVIVSIKSSLMAAAKTETLPVHYEDIHYGATVAGFVGLVTSMGLFVSFAGRLTGLILAKDAATDDDIDLSQRFYKSQSIACTVIKTDDENKRFLLALAGSDSTAYETFRIKNPVNTNKTSITDYAVGTVVDGVVAELLPGRLRVRLGDNLNAHIQADQWFTSMKQIKNKKNPFADVSVGDSVRGKIIGSYDSHSTRFMPVFNFTKSTVIALSALDKVIKSDSAFKPKKLSDLDKKADHTVVVELYLHGVANVALTPGIVAEIPLYNLSEDFSLYKNFSTEFPLGCVLTARIQSLDSLHNKAVLTARTNTISSVDDLEEGAQYPARVFKVAQNYVLVELAPGVVGYSFITDALNDYSENLQEVIRPHTAVLATITEIDRDQHKFQVSLRDESVAKDRPVNSIDQLKRGDLVRGFVKAINNNGIYVSLGREVFALVRVADLSDAYLTDWKKYFKLYQVVTGKISAVNGENRILMTMKESEVNGNLTTFKTFDQLEVGDVYDGSVRKVAEYGVFVKMDGTANFNGLCHRSQIADTPIENVAALFAVGDRVKVKILGIDHDKGQLALGMKASYFTDMDIDDDNESDKEAVSASASADSEEGDSDDDVMDIEVNEDDDLDNSDTEDRKELPTEGLSGLSTNGFDWTASILDQAEEDESSDDDEDFMDMSKKKRRKNKKQVEDKTAELNSRAPQSVADFERLLVGNPDSSVLWMNYMSFQLQLGEVDKSREIAERALKTINYREEQEKMNIWIAILNLENSFGTDESLEVAFKRAAQYMDSLTMHQKMIGIFQLSEKFDKANALYKTMTKKFSKHVSVWVQYGSFLVDREQNEEAHEVLARALQALSKKDHIEVVRKFAQLEFNKGDPEQGRSLFEGLVTDAPKRIDLWNVYIDQEIKQGDRERVVGLFERVITKKLSRKQAKFFFSKWLSYEEANGTEQSAARVKALAVEYVQANSKESDDA